MSKRLMTYDTQDVKNGKLNLKKNGTFNPEGMSSSGSSPDWNQNEATAPGYIKNRPFYEETVYGRELYSNTLEFTWDSTKNAWKSSEYPDVEWKSGKTYNINWNGIDYTINNATGSFGNSSVIGTSYGPTNAPFYFYSPSNCIYTIYAKDINLDGVTTTVKFPSQTLEFTDEDNWGFASAIVGDTYSFTKGSVEIITYDGVKYACVYKDSMPRFGNYAIDTHNNPNALDVGLPCYVDIAGGVIRVKEPGTHTIQIEEITGSVPNATNDIVIQNNGAEVIIHKLDKRFTLSPVVYIDGSMTQSKAYTAIAEALENGQKICIEIMDGLSADNISHYYTYAIYVDAQNSDEKYGVTVLCVDTSAYIRRYDIYKDSETSILATSYINKTITTS